MLFFPAALAKNNVYDVGVFSGKAEANAANRGKRFSKCGHIHNVREARLLGGECRKRLAASTQKPARIAGIDDGYGQNRARMKSLCRSLSPPYWRGLKADAKAKRDNSWAAG